MAHQTEAGHHAAVAEHVEEHTTTGINHRKLLMWVFLSSDCLFFGSLIATYMVYRGQSLVGPYPVDIIDVPITTISTFVLLCSSFAMVRALAATNEDRQGAILFWLLMTAFLGAIFIGFQVYEFNLFRAEGLRIDTNLFRQHLLYLDRFPRRPRDAGYRLAAGPGVDSQEGQVGAQDRAGRGVGRPVLALC